MAVFLTTYVSYRAHLKGGAGPPKLTLNSGQNLTVLDLFLRPRAVFQSRSSVKFLALGIMASCKEVN